MSTSSNEFPERRSVLKASFSPISSDVLIVRIRKVSTEVIEENIPKMSSTFQPTPRYFASEKEIVNNSKSTMTDCEKAGPVSSKMAGKEKTVLTSAAGSSHNSTPCLRHAAENISRKASDIPSEKINMCNNCSKSMLSYIFVVQDFLDSLSKEISGNETPHCLQCARQEVRNTIASSIESTSRIHTEYKSSSSRTELRQSDRSSSKRTSRAKGHHQESEKNEDYQKGLENLSHQERKSQKQQTEFIHNVSPPSIVVQDAQSFFSTGNEKSIIIDQSNTVDRTDPQQNAISDRQWTPTDNKNSIQSTDSNRVISVPPTEDSTNKSESTSPHYKNYIQSTDSNRVISVPPTEDSTNKSEYTPPHFVSTTEQHYTPCQQKNEQPADKPLFRAPVERIQPNYNTTAPVYPNEPSRSDSNNNLPVQSPSLYREDVDGIVSTLSNTEREIYDGTRNRAGWEGLTESQDRFGAPSSNLITSEAFVTSCRNNAEAIGCLVVGTSLLLCRTSRTLCVLVSDGVSTAFRTALSEVFQVVQYTRSLDSLGTTKLALLEQPELGVTFEKLNIWRLVQFTKCVYLNPDTLVIQNCDELFCREELSAVPDIGWPDCFNNGMFVYSPSVHTFWQLLEFADKEGSYDGGDQGVLNSYFNNWSSDISKKLSFIYNLMANVSYTYTPAFRQFGRDIKIVQFHGSFKPWHVKFFTKSGQISPSSPVHPTYVQFVHIWINIFRISILRLLTQEIQSYAASQETICAVETLRFFPLPTESEAEFFLTPPSVRLRLTEKKLQHSTTLPISEARRRKSAEFFRHIRPEDNETSTNTTTSKEVEGTDSKTPKESKSDEVSSTDGYASSKEEKLEEVSDEVFKERKATDERKKVKDESTMPGAEVGDYQGMRAWEQGRMDYQGTDSSDNVIKRLEFLMTPKPQ